MDKTFDAARAEAEILVRWEQAGAFRAGANARPEGKPFVVLLPPPNVTGSLHMGHAFNATLQDILVRWHRMQGDDTLWQPGQDHAGIATQMVVERELTSQGRRRTDMSREEFVNLVWQQKEKSGGTIIDQLKRLGASCDWSRNAFTMAGAKGDTRTGHENSPDFHDAVLKVFVDWYDQGLIFRGKRLVNWDPHFETAISDLEVENVEVDGHMWHFKYPLAGGETYEYVEKDEDGTVTLRETRDYISIATTRPETMLGDGAVAVHPSDERYAPIVGKLCEIPVGPKEHRRLIPIITDEYPDPAFGSGAVKITGAHDFNDYGVAQRNGIPLYRLMDTKGRMRTDGLPYAEAADAANAIAHGEREAGDVEQVNLVPEELRGLKRFAEKGGPPQARERVIAAITAEGLAVMVPETDPRLGRNSAASAAAPGSPQQGAPGDSFEEGATAPEIALVPLVEPKKIMQPFGDRSKVVIEPMLTDQWFVDAARLAGPALESVRTGETRIVPERDERVYNHWLENIEPWCISRQLWWGHQVPVWYDTRGNEFCALSEEAAVALADAFYAERYPDMRLKAVIADQDEEVSSEGDRLLRATYLSDMEGAHITAHGELEMPLSRDPDVLDTWFSSGIWPIGTMGWTGDPEADSKNHDLKTYYPSSVLVTGFDIIFFWVARMMMMQKQITGRAPFHTVYVHALVRDAEGRKMSKSLGNVLDPIELIDAYGADAVRFTLAAMAGLGRDLRLSTDRVAGYRNFGTKLWNAARFAEMNDCRIDPAFDPRKVELTANRWIVGEMGRLRESLDASLTAFRFNDAANALYATIWGRVCDWYVELAKPLFGGEGAAETRATMAWVLDQCLILLHPVMPFLTEALWDQTGARATLLAHADWPGYGADLVDPQADGEMSWVIALIEAIRSVRAETHVPAGAKVTLVTLQIGSVQAEALARNCALVARLARIARFENAEAAPKGAVTVALEGGTFCLPLADVIDVAAERARLAKALDKLGKETRGLRAKLGNDAFLARAPKEVVAENRTRLAALDDEAAVLAAAQSRLAAMD